MRDLNDTLITGTVSTAPRPFGGEGTDHAPGCEFTLRVHDEYPIVHPETNERTIAERDDFFGVVCYGPVRPRAMTLTEGDRILVKGHLRSESIPKPKGGTERKTKIRAGTIEHLRRISLEK